MTWKAFMSQATIDAMTDPLSVAIDKVDNVVFEATFHQCYAGAYDKHRLGVFSTWDKASEACRKAWATKTEFKEVDDGYWQIMIRGKEHFLTIERIEIK